MKKILFLILLVISFASCEVDYNYRSHYRFNVTEQTTYTPYYPSYYNYYSYDLYDITESQAYNESRKNTYYYSYYSGGYHVVEQSTCNYYRVY